MQVIKEIIINTDGDYIKYIKFNNTFKELYMSRKNDGTYNIFEKNNGKIIKDFGYAKSVKDEMIAEILETNKLIVYCKSCNKNYVVKNKYCPICKGLC